MSSRALRKLGGKDDMLPKADEDEDDSLMVDVRNTGAKPKMVNPFNLVNDTNLEVPLFFRSVLLTWFFFLAF